MAPEKARYLYISASFQIKRVEIVVIVKVKIAYAIVAPNIY